VSLLTTPSQTVGPYLRIGFTPLANDAIAPTGATGEHLTIEGRVTDGDGKPVSDAVLEVWQADASGKYMHAEDASRSTAGKFRGFGRILTDAQGAFRFTTVKPGPVPGPKGAMQAPHLVVTVFMRGLLNLGQGPPARVAAGPRPHQCVERSSRRFRASPMRAAGPLRQLSRSGVPRRTPAPRRQAWPPATETMA